LAQPAAVDEEEGGASDKSRFITGEVRSEPRDFFRLFPAIERSRAEQCARANVVHGVAGTVAENATVRVPSCGSSASTMVAPDEAELRNESSAWRVRDAEGCDGRVAARDQQK
jgi:hypothetical protein